ncbi:MAG: TldD/PmbA family protein [Deltaproteobacteria bacterium]|nr:TldD/PmbA family protein [Deltaproteobacteria bacterium]MBI2367781.1 TldD/PmbA family protein [Deltaproteobacteria bacterium]MBI2535320.1 TldD/PmbA family protein [Deltaproteobacteria bacterium]
MERMELSQDLAREILVMAKAKGATQGDVVMAEGDSFFVTVRMGEVEKISQAGEKRLGLRLFCGNSSASASTSDISRQSVERLVEDTSRMARATAQDPCGGLPAAEELAREIPDLDLCDDAARSVSVDEKIQMALAVEKSALAYDARIINSEGGEFSNHFGRVIYASSQGFSGEYTGSTFGHSVAPVAKFNGSMQRDYWYSSNRKFARLEPPKSVGEKAAQRVLRRLGGRKVKTCEVPVVFDPEMAGSLLRNLSSAISGYALYKGASFLIGKLGTKIASELMTVIDDGTIPGALGSRPFDGEGLPIKKKLIVDKGELRSYLLDTYSGKKLGMASTGNASRSVGEPPGVGPANFYLAPGAHSPDDIIRSVKAGLYVTELIGFGVNMVTGDYSRGAAGLWIENGELTYPVEEITIAGNLKQIFQDIDMIGNDLEMRGRIAAPTVKVSRMTVAGD